MQKIQQTLGVLHTAVVFIKSAVIETIISIKIKSVTVFENPNY